MKTKSKKVSRTKAAWECIGEVGVDSGTLMVCDPCYIDGHWIANQESDGYDLLTLNAKGKAMFPELKGFSAKFPFPWGTYGDMCPALGMSINKANDQQLLQVTDVDPVREFSYRGTCDAADQVRKGGEDSGQLHYKAGHSGVAVAFSSGYGDGLYPVYARKNKEGRVVEVRIIMGD